MMEFDGRLRSKDSQEEIRILAVRARVELKKPFPEICKLYQVSESALTKWLKKYRKGGYKALRSDKRGSGASQKKLSAHQTNALKKFIETKTPDQFGLPFLLWTREAIQMLIKKRYKVDVALQTLSEWLKNWGFSFQKPAKKALEQNPEAIKEWLEEEYPQIREKAKKENAEIQWLDESGIQTNQNNRKTFAPKGKTPRVDIPVRRIRCSYLASISNRGKMRFMVYSNRFNSEKLIVFLKRVIASSKRKIYLIMDNHPVHKSRKVKSWVEGNKEKIEIFYLPTYSPEMNPEENLNRHLKTVIFKEERPEGHKKLKKLVETKLRVIQGNPDLVKSYFKKENVSYARAA
ncbi:MAG TPA: IS630 family transposase [Vampirovibrionales bacterium]